MNLDFPAREIRKQQIQFGGKVKFKPALRRALECFVTDASEPESPLAIAIEVASEILNAPESTEPSPEVVQKARKILLAHMDLPSTRMRLLQRNEQPAGGESVAESWIFEIKIKTLSDHIQWAIVDRDGEVPAYCYGFN